MANLIVKKLIKLPVGTSVELTYDEGDVSNQKIVGVVTDNDGEENLEIRLENGEELIINYSLVRSFKTVSADTPAPKPVGVAKPVEVTRPTNVPKIPNVPKPTRVPLHQTEPADTLSRNDHELKSIFDSLPIGDKKLLSGVYDSFKYGIRSGDRTKMTTAATQARQILFREDDRRYYWSDEAVEFCMGLLRRVSIFDSEVCLVAERFGDAALCALKTQDDEKAGVYAITALLEKEPANVRDLFAILANAVVRTNDVSGLKVLLRHLPQQMEPLAQELLGDLLAAKNLQVGADRNRETELQLLQTLYTGSAMEKAVIRWLPEDLLQEERKRIQPVPVPKPVVEEKPVTQWGVIGRVDWEKKTGIIRGDDGREYTFAYADLANADMKKEIVDSMRSDLGGKIYDVKFQALRGAATEILPNREYVERARAVAAGSRENRFHLAYELCRKGLETADVRRAIGDLVKHALAIYSATEQTNLIQEAVKLAQKYSGHYPVNAFAYMDLAQCYAYLKKSAQTMEYAHKAMDCPGQNVRQKMTLLQQYLKLVRGCYSVSNDRKLLADMLEQIRALLEDYSQDIESTPAVRNNYLNFILPHRIQCECGLDLLEEADRDFALLPGNNPQKAAMADLLEKTRERLKPAPEPEPEPEPETAFQEELTEQSAPAAGQEQAEDWDREPESAEEEPEDDTPLVPYQDAAGWEALKLTKKDVADYALGITGPDRTAPMLAYLRVGAELNPQLKPLYRTVALAANDPMEKLDYSTTALINALADNDTAYPELNDLCMGAAFLRSSFLYGRDYDFTTQALRDSLAIDQQMPAFRSVCDSLEAFRREAGRPIDIYCEYRNLALIQVKEELDKTAAYADELHTKFVKTPPREGADFFRLVKTKQMLFDKDGYLATMLERIIRRDQEALENEREHFLNAYMGGSGPLESRHISQNAVDQLIAVTWDEAGRGMMSERNNNTLQGDRRNNLRSNISDILRTIARWYVISEQSAGLTWQNEQGEKAYARLQPVLMEQLQLLALECDGLLEVASENQTVTGLYLLASTARELCSRLEGSWKCGQENYLYADFLRSGQVLLKEDFMPDLSATFCVLPAFNILQRIRAHVEEPRLSWQEQVDRIYGRDMACGNYGTADQIAQYLEFMGGEETVTFPENREEYIKRTKMQIEIRYRSFLETYALAMNRGQIMKSDAFSYSLEDTVRWWNAICRGSRNYGFLAQILHHGENQIRTAARQYEEELSEQLEALIARNPQDFDKHPDYVAAIRGEIANQNFTVAEDWMARIRIGDFSLEVVKPQAVKELEHYFFNRYIDIYKRVADASRTLQGLVGRRDARNKDARGAQQLIENWIASGSAGTERIRQLLNLLGWRNIQVARITHPTAPRAELYQVTDLADQNILTAPQHPIAAFGSELEKPRDPDKKQQHMYVACLYGVYDCERLYDQMRTLDGIQGSKIFLLDYALSQSERRNLARKLKERGTCLDNVNMVIDRVLITYLADNYNENLINRTLMATAMPFSYCQPYVVDSIQTMPPEIFIGRKDELRRIERYDGVNLIYGGRQLGKSALFKKAVSDLDGRNGQRAIRVDIKDLDCAAAARKVSMELAGKGILTMNQITDDWDLLCLNIKMRLRSKTDEISYFLLMLDEADELIKTSAACNYQPLVALKDVQETMDKRFKYVLAGLHNVVKFNRDVALGKNSVITHMSSLKITPFFEREATELLTGPLSYLGFSLPSKVTVSQILATCNYFPGLIQLYAQKLIESVQAADYAGYSTRNSPPYEVTDDHLRRVMSDKEFVATIYEKFEITLKLDEDQGSCYYPLALLIGWMYNVAHTKNGYTAQDVLEHARDLQIAPLNTLDEEKIDALLQELQDLNILRSVSSNSYLLASKNFRDLLGSDEEIFDKLRKIGGGEA